MDTPNMARAACALVAFLAAGCFWLPAVAEDSPPNFIGVDDYLRWSLNQQSADIKPAAAQTITRVYGRDWTDLDFKLRNF